MSRVGLFFGSFNPIHKAHISIAQFVLNKNLVDEVWLVVSPQNPFKDSGSLLPYEHRFEMARLGVEDVDGVCVSDVERNMPTPSYTDDTLAKLRQQHPEHEFIILMGGDNLAGFTGWKDHETILENHSIICYSRAESKDAEFAQHPKVTILDGPLLDASSTNVRADLAAGRDITQKMPEKVARYIADRSLFN